MSNERAGYESCDLGSQALVCFNCYLWMEHKLTKDLVQPYFMSRIQDFKGRRYEETTWTTTTTPLLLLTSEQLQQTYTVSLALKAIWGVALVSEPQRAEHLKLTSSLMRDSRLSDDWGQSAKTRGHEEGITFYWGGVIIYV